MLARALTVSTTLFMLVDSINQLGIYLGVLAWAALYMRRPAPISLPIAPELRR